MVNAGLFAVLPPDGSFALGWGALMLFIVIYQAASVPFLVAFEVTDPPALLSLDFACALAYFADIVVSFNTSFYRKGRLVVSRTEISKHYATSWLALDVVSSIPYSWLVEGPFQTAQTDRNLMRLVTVTRLLRAFRLVRLVKMKENLSLLQQRLNDRWSIALTVLWLCMLMVSLAHWTACAFRFAAALGPNSWLQAFLDAGLFEQYVNSAYWAVTTLTTTGYGDVVPVNTQERILGIIIMILSAGVFSYLLGKIGTVIALLEHDTNEHTVTTMEASRFLKGAAVPTEVAYRALRYVDYVWETKNRRTVLDRSLLQLLSEPLRNQVCQHIFGTVLMRAPAFGLFGAPFVSQLARNVNTDIFAQDDVIFEQGQTSTTVYFLEKGCIEVFLMSHTLAVLSPGQHFGELAFFSAAPRTASVRCLHFTEVVSLCRETFLELVEHQPKAQYAFKQVLDRITGQQYGRLGISCYFCMKPTHLAYACPAILLHLDRQAIARKWARSRSMTMRPSASVAFVRRERKVRRALHYSLCNVRASAGTVRLQKFRLHPKESDSEDEKTESFVSLPEAQAAKVRPDRRYSLLKLPLQRPLRTNGAKK